MQENDLSKNKQSDASLFSIVVSIFSLIYNIIALPLIVYKYANEFGKKDKLNQNVIKDNIVKQGKITVRGNDGVRIYQGSMKNGEAYTESDKEKKINNKDTLVIRSKIVDKEHQEGAFNMKYERDKFKEGGKKIEVRVADNVNDIINALNGLKVINDEHRNETDKVFKLVLNQHGGLNGVNDLNLKQDDLVHMAEIVKNKGYKTFSISSQECNGTAGNELKKVAQQVADKTGLTIQIRSAKEGEKTFEGLTGTKEGINDRMSIKTIDANGVSAKRDLAIFKPKQQHNITLGKTSDRKKTEIIQPKQKTRKTLQRG